MSSTQSEPFPSANSGRDAAWVATALGSDASARQEALKGMYEAYVRLVYKVCWGVVDDPSAADDLAQETFVRAFEKLDRLRDPGSLRSWLCQVARNLAISHVRRGPVDFVAFEGQPEPSTRAPQGDVEVELDLAPIIASARDCIKALEPALSLFFRRLCELRQPSMIAKVYGEDRGQLKRNNDNLRYRMESCMHGKGYQGFKLKDWIAYEGA